MSKQQSFIAGLLISLTVILFWKPPPDAYGTEIKVGGYPGIAYEIECHNRVGQKAKFTGTSPAIHVLGMRRPPDRCLILKNDLSHPLSVIFHLDYFDGVETYTVSSNREVRVADSEKRKEVVFKFEHLENENASPYAAAPRGSNEGILSFHPHTVERKEALKRLDFDKDYDSPSK